MPAGTAYSHTHARHAGSYIIKDVNGITLFQVDGLLKGPRRLLLPGGTVGLSCGKHVHAFQHVWPRTCTHAADHVSGAKAACRVDRVLVSMRGYIHVLCRFTPR